MVVGAFSASVPCYVVAVAICSEFGKDLGEIWSGRVSLALGFSVLSIILCYSHEYFYLHLDERRSLRHA
jgi:hypothetical protein